MESLYETIEDLQMTIQKSNEQLSMPMKRIDNIENIAPKLGQRRSSAPTSVQNIPEPMYENLNHRKFRGTRLNRSTSQSPNESEQAKDTYPQKNQSQSPPTQRTKPAKPARKKYSSKFVKAKENDIVKARDNEVKNETFHSFKS